MKRILITGDHSYVGTNLDKWLSQWPEYYSVDTITLKNDDWKQMDFSEYDSIFHVAAIVHQKEKSKMKGLYDSINRDLPVEVAKKAKMEGVRQFIFMSSMAVYGLEGKVRRNVIIGNNTPCKPITLYGKSKLEAENLLNQLENDFFKVAHLRAPMIYGPNCPGNYDKLKRSVMKFRVFPLIHNSRSMIHIDNLCEAIRLILINQSQGTFMLQDKGYHDIYDLVREIAINNHIEICMIKYTNTLVAIMAHFINLLNKLFGNLVYETSLSDYFNGDYQIRDMKNAISQT